MKLLFDQNISFRIVKLLSDRFPYSKQIRELKLENATDLEILKFASTNGYQIVTFDSDFYDLASMYKNPPKIIWLRFGNTTTYTIAEKLLENSKEIQSFIQDEENIDKICLEIN